MDNAHGETVFDCPLHDPLSAAFVPPRTEAPSLTEAQLDGHACIGCGGFDGPMIPAGTTQGTQLFAHAECDPSTDHRTRRHPMPIDQSAYTGPRDMLARDVQTGDVLLLNEHCERFTVLRVHEETVEEDSKVEIRRFETASASNDGFVVVRGWHETLRVEREETPADA